MTRPGRAGRASIEIVGDVSRLGRQLERDAQRAVSDIDLDTTNISEQIGEAFAGGAAEGIDALAETLPDVQSHFDRVADLAEEAADSMALDFEDGGVRIRKIFKDNRKDADGLFDSIGEGARDAGEDVKTNLLRPLTSGFSRLGEVVTSAGSALAGLAITGTNPLGLATIALQVIAVSAAIPVIIGLAAALADLAGVVTLLPGAIGALSSVLIVGIVAFNGFGDAISAVLDGDPEKIAEAMERLAPAARAVVKEFQAVLPVFRQVGDAIQQGFFGQLQGIIRELGEQSLPRLKNELETLGAVLGRAFGDFGELLTSTENISILERLLVSTSKITNELGAAFANLGQSFFNAIDAGLPSLETLSSRLGEAVNNFANFINASIADGSFQEFLDDAIATLDELLALTGAVGELLGVLFGGTDDAGRGFIGTLTDITQRMTEFFKSAEGKDALEDFGEIIAAVGILLGVSANILRETIDIFTELDDAVNSTIGFFVSIGEAISSFWTGALDTTSSAADSVGSFFTDLGSDIADIWNDIVETVSGAIDSVVSFVSGLPDRIVAFIESIPDRVSAALDLMIDQVINILGTLTAIVIVAFTDLPGQIIAGLTAFLVSVRNIFIQARDIAINALLAVGEFIRGLPDRLAEAWDLLVQQVIGVFTTVKDFIVATWNDVLTFIGTLPERFGAFFEQVKDAVVARVTALIDFAKSIPERITTAVGNLGKLLYDAGANVIQGLINGISSRIGQLRDKISSAVQEIRDHLPFSPAKKGPLSGSGSPERAGAVIGSMIASGLDGQTSLITEAAGRAAAAAGIALSPLGEAGVTPLSTPIPGQRGTVLSPTSERTDEQPVFIVRIGNEEIEAFIDKRVDAAVSTEVRRLMAGTRGI